jgi:hypothetical protein
MYTAKNSANPPFSTRNFITSDQNVKGDRVGEEVERDEPDGDVVQEGALDPVDEERGQKPSRQNLKRRTEKHFLGPGSETCSKKLTHNLVSSV